MLHELEDHLSRDELIARHSSLHDELKSDLEPMPLEVFFAPQGDHWSPAEHLQHPLRAVLGR